MGAWYTIGLLVGIGVALGVAATGALRRLLPAAAAAAIVAAAIGLVAWHWYQAVGGVAGAACGAYGASPLVAATLRRGGTRGGTAALLALGSLVLAALAFIPVVGYLEVVAAPALAARLRRRTPDTHAGLRTLARD
jgi:hypothetical protein